MYLFRSRDRRLMEQTARDVALTLQRDYRTFNIKKTTQLSTRVTIYSGYLSTGANAYPNISWLPGTPADSAFAVLQQLLSQLAKGAYQTDIITGDDNPGIWPVQSITWPWIQSLYASINTNYAVWLVNNGIMVPPWSSAP
jgi:hypothetical protein